MEVGGHLTVLANSPLVKIIWTFSTLTVLLENKRLSNIAMLNFMTDTNSRVVGMDVICVNRDGISFSHSPKLTFLRSAGGTPSQEVPDLERHGCRMQVHRAVSVGSLASVGLRWASDGAILL